MLKLNCNLAIKAGQGAPNPGFLKFPSPLFSISVDASLYNKVLFHSSQERG